MLTDLFFNESIPGTGLEMIRKAIQRGQLTGSSGFIEEVFTSIHRRIELRGQGRPEKK
jgi:putative transposase